MRSCGLGRTRDGQQGRSGSANGLVNWRLRARKYRFLWVLRPMLGAMCLVTCRNTM